MRGGGRGGRGVRECPAVACRRHALPAAAARCRPWGADIDLDLGVGGGERPLRAARASGNRALRAARLAAGGACARWRSPQCSRGVPVLAARAVLPTGLRRRSAGARLAVARSGVRLARSACRRRRQLGRSWVRGADRRRLAARVPARRPPCCLCYPPRRCSRPSCSVCGRSRARRRGQLAQPGRARARGRGGTVRDRALGGRSARRRVAGTVPTAAAVGRAGCRHRRTAAAGARGLARRRRASVGAGLGERRGCAMGIWLAGLVAGQPVAARTGGSGTRAAGSLGRGHLGRGYTAGAGVRAPDGDAPAGKPVSAEE